MIIECTNCRSKYQYDEERFERKPSKKIKCAKCQTVFEIFNPAFAKAASVEVGESTSSARHEETRTAKPKQDTTETTTIPEQSTGRLTNAPQLPAGKRLSLAIIDGADAGTVFRIDKTRVTIGRSAADLVINDSEASRTHAALEIRDSTFVLEDLKSTNGTIVDGQRIIEPKELADKAEFQIGGTVIMLIVTDDA